MFIYVSVHTYCIYICTVCTYVCPDDGIDLLMFSVQRQMCRFIGVKMYTGTYKHIYVVSEYMRKFRVFRIRSQILPQSQHCYAIQSALKL
jgi:hypothetical protein